MHLKLLPPLIALHMQSTAKTRPWGFNQVFFYVEALEDEDFGLDDVQGKLQVL